MQRELGAMPPRVLQPTVRTPSPCPRSVPPTFCLHTTPHGAPVSGSVRKRSSALASSSAPAATRAACSWPGVEGGVQGVNGRRNQGNNRRFMRDQGNGCIGPRAATPVDSIRHLGCVQEPSWGFSKHSLLQKRETC